MVSKASLSHSLATRTASTSGRGTRGFLGSIRSFQDQATGLPRTRNMKRSASWVTSGSESAIRRTSPSSATNRLQSQLMCQLAGERGLRQQPAQERSELEEIVAEERCDPAGPPGQETITIVSHAAGGVGAANLIGGHGTQAGIRLAHVVGQLLPVQRALLLRAKLSGVGPVNREGIEMGGPNALPVRRVSRPIDLAGVDPAGKRPVAVLVEDGEREARVVHDVDGVADAGIGRQPPCLD